jgi:hypothetical protein
MPLLGDDLEAEPRCGHPRTTSRRAPSIDGMNATISDDGSRNSISAQRARTAGVASRTCTIRR